MGAWYTARVSPRTRWLLLLLGIALAFAAIFQMPQWMRMRSPLWRGVPVEINADEGSYLARVQEGLTGRPALAAEAFVGDPAIVGAQFATIEQIYGVIFAPTGWRAATVMQVADSIVPPLIFLALVWFFSLCGFSRRAALAASVFFVLHQYYNLGRPIHQRDSLLLELLALCALLRGLAGGWGWSLLGGALMGLLIGDTFWGWSFVWLWWGMLLAAEAATWLRASGTERAGAFRRVQRLLLAGSAGLVAGSPFLWRLWSLTQEPLFDVAKFRSGMHASHLPQSWPYAAAFFLMAAGAIATVRLSRGSGATDRLRKLRPAFVTVLAAAAASHQQIVHGVTFHFTSHYLSALVLGAIAAVLLFHALRTRWMAVAALGAAVYLAATGWDGRYGVQQIRVSASEFSKQHLASALPALDSLPRVRVLSDQETSTFIAGATRHDVVFSVYLKNVLLTNEELAERYCAQRLPLPPEERRIAEQPQLIYPDAVSVYRSDPSVRAREVRTVEEACARLDADPAAALKTFGVDYVFWNETQEPRWDLRRLRTPLEKVAADDGWSLWKVAP